MSTRYYLTIFSLILPVILTVHTPVKAGEIVLPESTASESSTTTATDSASTLPATNTPTVRYDTLPRIVLDERAQTRIINLSANMSNRMDATAERLDQIAGRLQSRISKIEATGFVATEAKTELGQARSFIAVAEEQLRSIDAEVQNAVFSENPQVTVRQLQDTFRNIATTLRSAHQSLQTALTLSKTPVRGTSESVSTSTTDVLE